MSIEQEPLKNIIEAALLAVAHPMSTEQLGKLFDDESRPSNNAIDEMIRQLQVECKGRGVELKEVASGYRYQARQTFSKWLSRLWEERPAKYSRAALETLALIAYRQPVTRAEIEDVRGVGVSSSIIKTMMEREWIRVVGHRDVPGRPALYATSKQFLDYFNLKSLEELPTLTEIKDLEELNPQLNLPDPDVHVEEGVNPVKDHKVAPASAASSSVDDQPLDGAFSDRLSTEQLPTEQLSTEQRGGQQPGVTKSADDQSADELDDVHTQANLDAFYEREEEQTDGQKDENHLPQPTCLEEHPSADQKEN